MHAQFMRSRLWQALIGLSLLSTVPLHAASFVYEGQLDDRGAPANGRYDIQLAVYRDAELGATLAAPMVFNAVEVREGRFRLDFDAKVDDGEPAWVELAVRDAGAGGFSTIPGRTKTTQAPAAIGACWSSVGDSDSNPATNFLGTTDAQPFVIRTRNAQSLRIEPSTALFGGNPITANVIAGSSANTVTSGVRGATISGGGVPSGESDPYFIGEAPNRVTDAYGTIGGGYANQAGDNAGTTLDNSFATVGGGNLNVAIGGNSSIGGGESNTASGTDSTVAGGLLNEASGDHSTVSGGVLNTASANSNVAGGFRNTASGELSTVGGGFGGTASGLRSNVAGGYEGCAGGLYSWVGGNQSKVRPGSLSGVPGTGCSGVELSGDEDGDEGSFVWGGSGLGAFTTTGPEQFAIRAAGGLRWHGTGVNSTTSPAFIHRTSLGDNTCDGGSGVNTRTYVNHPLLNDNPNAVIVLTANYGSTAGGGVAPPRNPIGLYYNATLAGSCPPGRWVIYQLTTIAEALNNGAKFNAWFVLP